MVRANARKLTPDSASRVRTRKVKKVVLNMEKVRKVLQVSGLLVMLTIANASIQALVAQTQFHLEEVQNEIKMVDQQIGWLQCELAEQISQAQIANLSINEPNVKNQEPSIAALAPNLVLPPSVLSMEPTIESPSDTVTAKIHDWLSGIGRTMAEGELYE